MLTGVRPFAHDDVAETLAAILMREPDWRALPASVPPNVRRVLTGCLEKNSHERLRDIGDVRLELRRSDRPVVARASSGVEGRVASRRNSSCDRRSGCYGRSHRVAAHRTR